MIDGIQFSGTAAGIKAEGLDLGLVRFIGGANVVTAYTRNRVKAAHIIYDKKRDKGPVAALVVNSGCANACTGTDGVTDAEAIAGRLSSLLTSEDGAVLCASTGVIGKRLPVRLIVRALPNLKRKLKPGGIDTFARAIMTTDTHPKVATATFRGKKEYHIAGVAKGSGMINPLFATMLAFLFTNCPLSPALVRRAFDRAVRESFERITVDGDCSTNDTVMLFTGRGDEDHEALGAFTAAMKSVMKDLALMIVRDGEGATRVVHITVKGAPTKAIAEKIARRIALSPLVKTAFFGCDPNWGRILCAAGDADVPLKPSLVEIAIVGETLVRQGVEVPFEEAGLKELMNRKEVEVVIDLHDGRAAFDIYTTDLTYDYVKINASYRT
jgi:glutamate N-acetyltransferase / amino-acid N-acetyltransferase